MIACTGYTWDEVGKLTIPRLKALKAYWDVHPPLHLMVEAYLGINSGAPTAKTSEALDQMLPGTPSIKGAPMLDTSGWQSRHSKDSHD